MYLGVLDLVVFSVHVCSLKPIVDFLLKRFVSLVGEKFESCQQCEMSINRHLNLKIEPNAIPQKLILSLRRDLENQKTNVSLQHAFYIADYKLHKERWLMHSSYISKRNF